MRLIERNTSRGTFLAYWINRLRPSPMGEIEAVSRICVNNKKYQILSIKNSITCLYEIRYIEIPSETISLK